MCIRNKTKVVSTVIAVILGVIGVGLIEKDVFNIVDLIFRGHTVYYFWGHLLTAAVDNVLGVRTFLHPNWWKVLLLMILYVIIGCVIISNLLLNYKKLYESLDLDRDTPFPIVWLIYYFATAGILLALFPDHDMSKIRSFVLLAGLLYLYISFGWIHPLLGFIGILLGTVLGGLIYLFCFSIFWLGLVLIIIGVFRSIGSLGGVTSKAIYNGEATKLESKRQEMLQNPENFDEVDATRLENEIFQHNNHGNNLLGLIY